MYQYDTSQIRTIRLNFFCTVVHVALVRYIGVFFPFVIQVFLVFIAFFIQRVSVITSAVWEVRPIEFLLLGFSESFHWRFTLWVNVSVISLLVLYRQSVSIWSVTISIGIIIHICRILIMSTLLLLIRVRMWVTGSLIGLVLVRIAAVNLASLIVSRTARTVVTPRINVTVRSEQTMSRVHIWHICVEDQQLEKTALTSFGLYWRDVIVMWSFSVYNYLGLN